MKLTAVLTMFVLGFWGSRSTMRADSLPHQSGVYKTINLPPGAVINGINDLDQLVGTVTDNTGTHGFLDSNGVFTEFEDPGSTYTEAIGINDAGQIVGYFGGSGPFSSGAFLYANGAFTTLAEGLVQQTGISINNAGTIVYTRATCLVDFCAGGFLYRNGTPTEFVFTPPPPDEAADTHANGINDSGQIVGSWAGGILHHGYRDGGGLLCSSQDDAVGCSNFDFPGTPTGINNAGEIVGNGFLDRNGLFSRLDFSATGINNRGEIVGGGNFIFTPTPEPASLLLFGCGLAAIGIVMKPRRSSLG